MTPAKASLESRRARRPRSARPARRAPRDRKRGARAPLARWRSRAADLFKRYPARAALGAAAIAAALSAGIARRI
jgi:hypothetical protein